MNGTQPRHVDDDLKAYLDGELGTVRRLRVARHLAACATCRERELEMKQISQQLKGWGSAGKTLSPNLRANLLAHAPEGRALYGATAQPLWRRSPALVFGGGGLSLAASLAAFAILYNTANHTPALPAATTTTEAVAVASAGQAVQEATEVPGASAYRAVKAPMAAPASDADRAKDTAVSSSAGLNGNVSLRNTASEAYGAVDKLDWNGHISAAKAVPPPVTVAGNVMVDTRQVHREASLGVAVDNPEAASTKVEMQVKEWGGYVASNVLNTDDSGYKSAELTLKVPEERFDEMLASIGKLGDVRFKNLTGEDITEQTVSATSDEQVLVEQVNRLNARLKKENLSDRRTTQLEVQVRQIEQELARTRARLGMLRKLARLSTLNVTLTETKKVPVVAEPATGFWADMRDSNRSALKAFQAAVRVPLLLTIWLMALSPIWLPLLLVYRHLARKQAVSQAVPVETDCPGASDK